VREFLPWWNWWKRADRKLGTRRYCAQLQSSEESVESSGMRMQWHSDMRRYFAQLQSSEESANSSGMRMLWHSDMRRHFAQPQQEVSATRIWEIVVGTRWLFSYRNAVQYQQRWTLGTRNEGLVLWVCVWTWTCYHSGRVISALFGGWKIVQLSAT
jgi:hypothetical protein